MHLPACFASLILTFAPVFVQQRTWRRAELLLVGAILAPGKRTVTSLLRIAGLGRERRFTNDHRVLNRAAWDARAAARLLLGLLIAVFAPSGPVRKRRLSLAITHIFDQPQGRLWLRFRSMLGPDQDRRSEGLQTAQHRRKRP